MKVDTQLKTISPPCLPFQLDFTLKTSQLTNHNGIYPICFNGEFYKNVGIRMMRMKYTAIDDMYKALEEAELRYARIDGIKKSLGRVEKEIKNESKRGRIPPQPVDDPVELMLTKIAKRRIPAFTLKSDKTTLAFQHYSPWATIKRSDPFEMESKSPYHDTKHDIASFQGTYSYEFSYSDRCCRFFTFVALPFIAQTLVALTCIALTFVALAFFALTFVALTLVS